MGNRTFTQVPPDSTGDKLAMRNRTKGADTILEQSVYLSEEETYLAVADAVAFAANKHHLTIFNATGSGVTLRIHQIRPINLALTAISGVGINNIWLNEIKNQPFVIRENEGVTVQQITSSTVGSFAWLIVFSVETANADV